MLHDSETTLEDLMSFPNEFAQSLMSGGSYMFYGYQGEQTAQMWVF